MIGRTIILVALLTFAFGGGVLSGALSAREQMRAAQQSLSAGAVNTFTRCLVENWEASGELVGSGKRWVLQ